MVRENNRDVLFRGKEKVEREDVKSFELSSGKKMVRKASSGEQKSMQVMYDAMWLANHMVREKDRSSLNHSEEVSYILDELKRFIKDEKGEWARDEKGHRIYSRRLYHDVEKVEEIENTPSAVEGLKKAWEWEIEEHIENSQYIDEVAWIEEYFNRILKGNSPEEEEIKDRVFSEGWISLIEKVEATEYSEWEGCNFGQFCIIGEADLVSIDTLYYVTRTHYDSLWATIYLNILNMTYEKPFLAVLTLTNRGEVLLENVKVFNESERKLLIEWCKKCVEGEVDAKEMLIIKETLEFLIGRIPQRDRIIGCLESVDEYVVMKTCKDFLHNYLDYLVEDIEGIFSSEIIEYIKNMFTTNHSRISLNDIRKTKKLMAFVIYVFLNRLRYEELGVGIDELKAVLKSSIQKLKRDKEYPINIPILHLTDNCFKDKDNPYLFRKLGFTHIIV